MDERNVGKCYEVAQYVHSYKKQDCGTCCLITRDMKASFVSIQLIGLAVFSYFCDAGKALAMS